MESENDQPHAAEHPDDGSLVSADRDSPVRTIDTATAAILERLADEAPDLADLVRRAVRDESMSHDVVYALEVAARTVNRDVVHALTMASRSIGEDVAATLTTAGRQAADSVAASSETLTDTAERVAQAVERLKALTDSLETRAVRRVPPAARGQRRRVLSDEMLAGSFDDTRFSTLLKVFVLGMGAGLLAVLALQAIAVYWWS